MNTAVFLFVSTVVHLFITCFTFLISLILLFNPSIFHLCYLISKNSCFYFYSIPFMSQFNKMFFYKKVFLFYWSFFCFLHCVFLSSSSLFALICLSLEVFLKWPLSLDGFHIYKRGSKKPLGSSVAQAGLLTTAVPPIHVARVLRPPADVWNHIVLNILFIYLFIHSFIHSFLPRCF